MKKLLYIILALLFAVSAYGFDYVVWQWSPEESGNCDQVAEPNTSKPAVGEGYTDPLFNTPITRITDYVADGDDSMVQYTTFSCGNSDNTKVAFRFRISYDMRVYSTADNSYLGTIDVTPSAPYPGGTQEFKWSQDPSTPNVGYFRHQEVFYKVDISAGYPGIQSVVHDFSADYSGECIQNNDKGEQSWGSIGGYYDRYWAFIAGDAGAWMSNVEDLIIYDRGTDTAYTKDLQTLCTEQGWTGCGSVRWATMSPSGDYLIAKIYDTSAGASNIRLIVMERSGESSLALVWTNCLAEGGQFDFSHPTWGYTVEGEEFIFFCDQFNDVAYYDLDDGDNHILFQVQGAGSECSADSGGFTGCGNHWSSSYNRSLDGWIFGTGYGNTDDPSSWMLRELIGIRLSSNPDDQRVWRIAYMDNISRGYYSQSRAQITQDGQNIYFTANFGGAVYTQDIYRATLPANWWNDIGNTGNIIGITGNVTIN